MRDIAAAARTGDWLTRERITVYAILLLIAYALNEVWVFSTAQGLLDSLGRPLGTDFANVWSSGKLVLLGRPEAALSPYDLRPFQQALFGMGAGLFYGWHYPPLFLGVAALLATLPYTLALVLWLASTGALYLVAVRKIFAGLDVRPRDVVLTAAAYPAVFTCITHGQNGFLSAALMGGGLVLLPARPVLAGVLLGLLAYKPQYGLLIPVALVVAGAWRTIASACMTVAATVALSIAAFGTRSWAAFFEHASFTRETLLENGGPGWSKLQGVFPAVRLLGGGIELAYALQLLTIGALAAMIVWLWRSPASDPQKAAGLILATMLSTPYAFNYDTVLLGPAIAYLVADGVRGGFAPYEKTLLAVLWVTPLLSRELTAATSIPVATLVNAIVLACLLAKVHTATVRTLPPASAKMRYA